jgi:hypothetical protein
VRGRCHVFLLCLLAALAITTTAGAAGGKWVTQTDKPEGFAITVPTSLWFVPNSVAKVKAIELQLAQQNNAGAAAVYAEIRKSSDVTKFVYEGFFYTPSATVQPLFTLAVLGTAAANTTPSALSALAKSSASALQKKGDSIVAAKVVTLPAGHAALVEATEPGTTKTLLVQYTIGAGSRVYQLTFRTDAKSKASLATFQTIAKRFALA